MKFDEIDLWVARAIAIEAKRQMRAKGRALYYDEVNAIVRRFFSRNAPATADKWVSIFERALFR